MKVSKESPLPQFNDQEGTHFCKKCKQPGCLGFYRRTANNDLPICDECGHVYRSQELMEKVEELSTAPKELIRHRREWMQDSNGLHPTNLIAKLDYSNIPTTFQDDAPDIIKQVVCISRRKWRKFGRDGA